MQVVRVSPFESKEHTHSPFGGVAAQVPMVTLLQSARGGGKHQPLSQSFEVVQGQPACPVGQMQLMR